MQIYQINYSNEINQGWKERNKGKFKISKTQKPKSLRLKISKTN